VNAGDRSPALLPYATCLSAADQDQNHSATGTNMPSKRAASLSPEVEKRIAEIETMMTLLQVQWALMECLSDIPAGRITAYEGNALSRAADKRRIALERKLRA
jgi:hypothetical protein